VVRVEELEVHVAEQTHEIVKVPQLPMLLVSQMSPSTLVKIALDEATEELRETRSFAIDEPGSMLHGLAVSERYPGHIWATLQAANVLLLLEPGATVDTPPSIVRTISIPAPGKGPHYIGEYGDVLCASLKDSNHVLVINHVDERKFELYDALAQPIFVALHPATGELYASQDKSSRILRVNRETGATSQIAIPAERGATPVGLVPALGDVWFVLLGPRPDGGASFGRIAGDADITWFTLPPREGPALGLLHLAFDPPGGDEHGAWLLSSSIGSPDALDALIRVTFDPTYTDQESERVSALPTQHCMAHRVLPLTRSVVATEMMTSTVAQLRY